jgi:3-phytase
VKKAALSALTMVAVLLAGCPGHEDVIVPLVVTDAVKYDGDDPAIWVDQNNASNSLVVVTDKNTDGSLYVFNLDGNEVSGSRVTGLDRPNNVDIEYGLALGGTPVDIAVATERNAHMLRVYQLPDMMPIDNGGLPVFEGEVERDCMGIALYKREDGAIFAIVSRTAGPSGSYLWEYRLEDDGSGKVMATHVRSFGTFSGVKEIESIAVDDVLGYVYYSDEGAGIRKYHANPDATNASVELAFFGQDDFKADSEGISIYTVDETTGYILVSDQQANLFRIYPREGDGGDPGQHTLIKTVALSTLASDGSEVCSQTLSAAFPGGLFVAMSADRHFQYYSWEQIAEAPGLQLLSR